MLRPQVFQQAHIAVRNLPYTTLEDSMNDPIDTGGVLGSGHLVWTESAFSRPCPNSAVAFVDGIGMVRVDPRCLTAPRV